MNGHDRLPWSLETASSGTIDQSAGQAPKKPYVQATGTGPVPDGWAAVPAGTSRRGRPVELVYDPQVFDVLVSTAHGGHSFPHVDNRRSVNVVADALAVSGWRFFDGLDSTRVWVRDRGETQRLAAEHGRAGVRPAAVVEALATARPYMQYEEDEAFVPPGWITVPAGRWMGRDGAVLVADPTRHEVLRVNNVLDLDALSELTRSGWQVLATDGDTHLLARGRADHVLARAEQTQERRRLDPPSREVAL